MHTYLGGTVAGLVAGLLTAAIDLGLAHLIAEKTQRFEHLLHQSRRRTVGWSIMGGLFGGISHIFLDSLMHRDMHPFWPFVGRNDLVGAIDSGALHAALALSGLLGAAFLAFQLSDPILRGKNRRRDQPPDSDH